MRCTLGREAHRPGSAPVQVGGRPADRLREWSASRVPRMGALAEKAPITRCPAKIGENETCGRKTVGVAGRSATSIVRHSIRRNDNTLKIAANAGA